MQLTDTAIRNAKPGEKPIRLFDGGGLSLEVSPGGGKWWRLKYRLGQVRKSGFHLAFIPTSPWGGEKTGGPATGSKARETSATKRANCWPMGSTRVRIERRRRLQEPSGRQTASKS